MITTSFTIKPVPRVLFGPGNIEQLPTLTKVIRPRLLVITGKSSFTSTATWSRLQEQFSSKGISIFTAAVSAEPSPADVDSITANNRPNRISSVISIGGGSVLDTGKAVAAMLTEEGAVKEYLEEVGTRAPSGTTLPFIAVPTTSGTGSEATANSVISQMGKNGFKKSLRHDNFIPDIALIDPELTVGCSKEQTAACGMDCFTQLVEGYLSTAGSPYTDSLALEAISAIFPALQTSYRQPQNIEARSAMSYGAFISGVVLANAGLGTVHGCAPVLGSMFGIPHGVACGTLMLSANRITLKKLEAEQKNTQALQKYTALGKAVSNKEKVTDAYYRQLFIEQLAKLTEAVRIPSLSTLGIPSSALVDIAEKTGNKNNPIPLTREDILQMLEERF